MNFTEFDMSEKVTLVTGAAGLLGRAHCEALLEAGSVVVATDINLDVFDNNIFNELYVAYKERLIFEPLDVASLPKCHELNAKLKNANLKITTLINNAAINPNVDRDGLSSLGRLSDFSVDIFHREVSVGLTGAINCGIVFGEEMDRNGSGNILNIASDLSVIAPSQFLYSREKIPEQRQAKKPVSYSAIKHGLIGVTKYFATYFESGNVRCNALSPGGVFVDQPIEFVKRLEKLIPLGRMAEVDEYKGVIKFLCSDASKYMNGHNLVVDGGRSIW